MLVMIRDNTKFASVTVTEELYSSIMSCISSVMPKSDSTVLLCLSCFLLLLISFCIMTKFAAGLLTANSGRPT
jgi:hypothetical protein